MHVIQAMNIIQQITQFPEVTPEEKIKFTFKKEGFNKLLIFDLDETLIHSKDEDDDEYDFVADNYGEPVADEQVLLVSPTPGQGTFNLGIFIRPYVHECLRAANLDYEVAVFTAADDWYANPIINAIDPTGTLIQHRYFRQHTKSVMFKGK